MIDHSLTGVALGWKAPQNPPGTGACGFNTGFVFSKQTWNLKNDPRAHPTAGSFTDHFSVSLGNGQSQACDWRICTPYSMGAVVKTGGDESVTYYLENSFVFGPLLIIRLGYYAGQFYFEVSDDNGTTVIRTVDDTFSGTYYVSCCYSPPDPPSGNKSDYMKLYINSWSLATEMPFGDSTVGVFLSSPEFSTLSMDTGLDVDYLGGFSDSCNCGSAPSNLIYAKGRGGIFGQRDKVIRQQNLLRRMLASIPAEALVSSLITVRSCAGCNI